MKTSKNCVRLFACFLLAGSTIQSTNAQKLGIAPETGLVRSFYRPADKSVSIDGNSMMYNFGANIIVAPRTNWTASAGLFCVANEMLVANEADSKTGTLTRFRFKHLQLPVNIGYKKKVGYGSFWLQGGANLGYNFSSVNERWERTEPMGDIISINKSKIKSENRLDLGLNASLSYIMPFGLFGKIQYYYGLNQLHLVSMGDARRQFLCFNAGYIFKIK